MSVQAETPVSIEAPKVKDPKSAIDAVANDNAVIANDNNAIQLERAPVPKPEAKVAETPADALPATLTPPVAEATSMHTDMKNGRYDVSIQGLSGVQYRKVVDALTHHAGCGCGQCAKAVSADAVAPAPAPEVALPVAANDKMIDPASLAAAPQVG